MKHHTVGMSGSRCPLRDRVGSAPRRSVLIAVAATCACLAIDAQAREGHGTLHVKAVGGSIDFDDRMNDMAPEDSINARERAGGAGAVARYAFPTGTNAVDYSSVYSSWYDSGPDYGAESLARAEYDLPVPPHAPGDVLQYTLTADLHVGGFVGSYYGRLGPAGSPFGDNPTMQVYTKVTGGSGGFYLGNPRTYLNNLGYLSGTTQVTRIVTSYFGESLRADILSAGYHYPSPAADYGLYQMLGDVKLNVDSVVVVAHYDFTPPSVNTGPSRWYDPTTQWSGPTGATPAPNAPCAIALLGAASSPTVVELDQNVTLGRLAINSPSGGYIVTGPGTVTLACSSNAVEISTLAGNHVVSAPISVQNDVTYSASGSEDSLGLTSTVSYATGVNVTKAGDGLVTIPVFAAESLTAAAGKLKIAAGSAPGNVKVKRLDIAVDVTQASPAAAVGGAQVDLQNNRLFIDYDPSTDLSPLLDVATNLHWGYNAGAWNGFGIVATMPSGQYRLGYAEISSIGSPTTFLGETVDASTVAVRRTWGGDTDLDGDVDFTDLLALAQSYNQTGKLWVQGDFDYDGDVDFADQLLLAQNYGATPLRPAQLGLLFADGGEQFVSDFLLAQSLVPEPTSLMALGGFAVLGVRARRRLG